MHVYSYNEASWDEAVMQGYTPYIMHDMPVHPGFEMEEALIESEHSIIYQQAENRMHVQKSLLLHLLQAE